MASSGASGRIRMTCKVAQQPRSPAPTSFPVAETAGRRDPVGPRRRACSSAPSYWSTEGGGGVLGRCLWLAGVVTVSHAHDGPEFDTLLGGAAQVWLGP
jgi:hypothetical protein